ncbi:MAG: hypothetical protein WB792_12615 [Desulfobacterales bacterium]
MNTTTAQSRLAVEICSHAAHIAIQNVLAQQGAAGDRLCRSLI